MWNNIRRGILIIIIIALLVIFITTSAVSYAFFHDEESVNNEFNTADYKIEAKEFFPVTEWEKDTVLEKIVTISNVGEANVLLRISYNEIDVLLYFRSTSPNHVFDENEYNLLRMCDVYNVPVATNIATAEVLVCALDNGGLDWREIVNPKSEYNRRVR